MNGNTVISISKEQIATLPVVTFQGTISLIDTEQQAVNAIDEIRATSKLVGFDTETKPAFRKGHTNNVALMQVSNGDHSWLFRINKIGISESIRSFLESPEIIKVGLSLKDDFFVMHRSAEFAPAGFIDLQAYVRQFNIADSSLQKIYAILFGYRISKSQRLSNWEANALTPGQQKYASIDAWACLKIYTHLASGTFKPEESPYKVATQDTAAG